MNNINPHPNAHTDTSAHTCMYTHTYIHVIRCPLTSTQSAISGYFTTASASHWRLLFLQWEAAILSLCVTLLLHKEPQSGLIIFGLFIHFVFELGCSVFSLHSQSHTGVLTDVEIHLHYILHLWYINSLLIGFQPKNTVQWVTVMQLSLSHYYRYELMTWK